MLAVTCSLERKRAKERKEGSREKKRDMEMRKRKTGECGERKRRSR